MFWLSSFSTWTIRLFARPGSAAVASALFAKVRSIPAASDADGCGLLCGQHLRVARGELGIEQRLVGTGQARSAQARHVGGEGINHRW
jgi:hypothetical protein